MELTTNNKIIVGSGNPGYSYEATRHNLGFEFIDYFAEKDEILLSTDKRKAVYGVSKDVLLKEGESDNKWILLKPQTFVSILGESILYLAAFYKVKSSNIFLVYDDINLECGEFLFEKVDVNKSYINHSAVKNTLEVLNSEEFYVLGIGIGSVPRRKSIEDYYLEPFLKEQREKVDSVFPEVYSILKEFLENR